MHGHTAIILSSDIVEMFVYYLLFRGCNFELKTYELPEIRYLSILSLYQSYEYNDPDNNGSLVN
jgi:hypothetical protein